MLLFWLFAKSLTIIKAGAIKRLTPALFSLALFYLNYKILVFFPKLFLANIPIAISPEPRSNIIAGSEKVILFWYPFKRDNGL